MSGDKLTLVASMTMPPSFFPALRILLPFALGYYLSYVFRTINAVIASDLVADIGFSAAGLGLMTSAYFLSFAACQLPLGVILDRIGPRKTEAALLLLAAAGSFWFAMAETETGLICARALIGIGVSACPNNGVSEYRSIGVSAYRRIGVSEYRSIGVSAYRRVGVSAGQSLTLLHT